MKRPGNLPAEAERLSLPELMAWAEEHLCSPASAEQIERFEITKNGDIQVRLTSDGNSRWFSFEQGAAKELSPESDQDIPLSRSLGQGLLGEQPTILAYRPGRRLVVRTSENSESQVVKGYRKGKTKNHAGNYALAAAALADSGLKVPQPIKARLSVDCLSMPFHDGKRPTVSVHHAEMCKMTGWAISHLQHHRDGLASLAGFGWRDELAVLDERIRRLKLVDATAPDGWPDLRQRIEQAREKVQSTQLVAAHRDLHDGQLLLTDSGLYLLDFDLMCVAEPELDPANLLAHLVLRGLQHPDRITYDGVKACGKKILDGLGQYARSGFWERLRFYQATSFCRLALVYELRPRWNFLVPDLIRFGHRCLDDLQRITR